MLVKFTEKGSWLVFAMVRNPNLLGVLPKDPLPPYKAPDDAASLQIRSLNKLIDAKLTQKEGDNINFVDVEVRLRKSLVQRLKEMLKHYAPMTRLTPNVEAHMELSYALDGKEPEALDEDAESWEEPEGGEPEDEDDKKAKEKSKEKPEAKPAGKPADKPASDAKPA
jgi:hypothetical protein